MIFLRGVGIDASLHTAADREEVTPAMADYDPNTHPVVRAAYAARLAAWEETRRLAEAGPEASAAEYRLYLADRAHHEAWLAASKQAYPELADHWQQQHMTRGDWQDRYPGVAIEPTPYELWLTDDPEATWDDPNLAGPAEREVAPTRAEGRRRRPGARPPRRARRGPADVGR
jgi:hypothetical protein